MEHQKIRLNETFEDLSDSFNNMMKLIDFNSNDNNLRIRLIGIISKVLELDNEVEDLICDLANKDPGVCVNSLNETNMEKLKDELDETLKWKKVCLDFMVPMMMYKMNLDNKSLNEK
jgi:predicted RNase H-like nuclease